MKAVFDHPVIHRCQLHKIRNVESKLPKALAKTVTKKMRAIYHYDDALRAAAELEVLARQLQGSHPGAAGSLREGLGETLTVMAREIPSTLGRTLRSTNAIESMIEICRDHSTNVKRWRDGQVALRWCAAGMVEAGRQFRKVNGFLHLPALRAHLMTTSSAVSHRSTTTRRTPPESPGRHRSSTELGTSSAALAILELDRPMSTLLLSFVADSIRLWRALTPVRRTCLSGSREDGYAGNTIELEQVWICRRSWCLT